MDNKIYVYDFDKTIYDGDSTVNFYFYCVKRFPKILLCLPVQFFYFILYLFGVIDKTACKDKFFMFFRMLPDIDALVRDFWEINYEKIKDWYKKRDHSRDVIISASPEFLLALPCRKLGVKLLLASKVDRFTGRYSGKNCYGEEKVRRLSEALSSCEIEEFYSDSVSDTPLALCAKKSFIVLGEELVPWNEYRPRAKEVFLSRSFFKFLVVGIINTFNGILFARLFSLAFQANIAFCLGYAVSLTIAYFINTYWIFYSRPEFGRYIKFCLSYIPNFILQNLIVFIFYNLLRWEKLIAYTLAAVVAVPLTFLLVKFFAFYKKTN